MRSSVFHIFCLLVLISCTQLEIPQAKLNSLEGRICFGVEYSDEKETKATPVTYLSTFNVSCVKGSPGSDVKVFDSKVFSLVPASSPATYAGDVWWPATNESFRFYASNVAMTYSAAGATVSVTNDTDVLCAYQASPTFEATNTLAFKHIFACISEVKVVSDRHKLSNISIWIKDVKTGGTYNIRTGAGQTDGTGWSSLTPTTSTNTLMYSNEGTIVNNGYDTSSPDFWVVPGDYVFICTWTAELGEFSKTYSLMETAPISVSSGKNNKIVITLSGGGNCSD